MNTTHKLTTLAVVAAVVCSAFVVTAGATVQQQTANDESQLTVSGLTAPDAVGNDETVEVGATVTNDGDNATTEYVTFRLAGSVVDQQLVRLEPAESQLVTFEVNATGVPAGTYIHGIFTESDGQLATIEVTDQPPLQVGAIEAPTEAVIGDSLNVSAEVTNPGNETANESVEFRLNGAVVDSTTVEVEANATTTVEFTANTSGADAGTNFLSVFAERGGNSTAINMTAEPDEGEPTPEPSPDGEAAVTFEDQESDGETVTVANATLPEGGFVVIHDATLLDGDAVGSVVGVSDYLAPGEASDINVSLNETLTESQTLIAMPHLDDPTNFQYDFVTSNGTEDPPYTVNETAVTDDANITVEGEPATETPGEETETPGEETETPGEETDTPAEETETPGEETLTPGEETDTPAEETDTPAEETETDTDGVGTDTPAAETPDEGTDTPGEETLTPGVETDTPGEETLTPGTEADTTEDDEESPSALVNAPLSVVTQLLG
jgi:hypothetical protein